MPRHIKKDKPVKSINFTKEGLSYTFSEDSSKLVYMKDNQIVLFDIKQKKSCKNLNLHSPQYLP